MNSDVYRFLGNGFFIKKIERRTNMEMVDIFDEIPSKATSLASDLASANGYQMVGIVKASEYENDYNLYYVIVKSKRGRFASFLMDSSLCTFQLGKYDFETHAECMLDILKSRVIYKRNSGIWWYEKRTNWNHSQ